MFGKLRKAGLTVKERKCSFGKASCEYLGYIVGSRTVQPMEGKVASITEFRRPKKKKEVRSFLGMCGYYRKFIANFATSPSPL